MNLENLRRQLIQVARATPVQGHAPVGFDARVRQRTACSPPPTSPVDAARAWLDGLGQAAYWAGGIAAAVALLHAYAPAESEVDDEPDLLGHALLADVPGLTDDAFPEEGVP